MRLELDLGGEEEIDELAAHLAARGLGVDDVLAVADWCVPRRKGNRLYAYGRGSGGTPIVVVLGRRGTAWRARTAWPMDEIERRWWRRQGGR
jgi:hypothetical protein